MRICRVPCLCVCVCVCVCVCLSVCLSVRLRVSICSVLVAFPQHSIVRVASCGVCSGTRPLHCAVSLPLFLCVSVISTIFCVFACKSLPAPPFQCILFQSFCLSLSFSLTLSTHMQDKRGRSLHSVRVPLSHPPRFSTGPGEPDPAQLGLPGGGVAG